MRSGTIHSTIKKLKLMTYTAYKNGWIPTDPFAGFYVRPEYSERRYLSASELQAVMDVRLPNYRTGINRDAFVFCAFTGLSHADVVKLTHADIHTDDNGERWIIDRRQKTGTQFRVKLLPVAEMLYERYKDMHLSGDRVFPLKGTYNTLNMSLACCQTCRSVVQPDDSYGASYLCHDGHAYARRASGNGQQDAGAQTDHHDPNLR